MSKNVKVIILRTAGTNCDQETKYAFESLGAGVELVHINQILREEKDFVDYHILAIPGGFSYGDDIASGKILANELRLLLGDHLREFVAAGKPVIGICNGFQVLVKAGILPGFDFKEKGFSQQATLTNNDSAKFEDRWVHLKPAEPSRCIWTKGMQDVIYLPVAHAEGKFVPQDTRVLERLRENNQIVFRYCNSQGEDCGYPANPNGSFDHIAGICDATGCVFGLMPHPERHFLFTQHPFWTRLDQKDKLGDGAQIFRNGINYVRESLL